MSTVHSSPSSTRPPSRPSSIYSAAGAADDLGSVYPRVDVLLLGSGWTSSFLLPALFANDITFAYTNRSGVKPQGLPLAGHPPIRWTCPSSGDSRMQWRKSFREFPIARMVVVVMPLKDDIAARELVASYQSFVHEKGGQERTKWCVLSSTGVFGPGQHSSSSPVSNPTPRSHAEDALAQLAKSDATILSLAGLYGGSTRHPQNWLSKVASDQEKLASKGSLHLLHGKDVARAVLGVWRQVGNGKVWDSRWIVTDGRVYDWWQLVTQLPQTYAERSQYKQWVEALRKQYDVGSLPRSVADAHRPEQQLPRFLERALSSDEFWKAIGERPSVGPATEVDLPVSSLTNETIASDGSGSALVTPQTPEVSSKVQPWTPSISNARLQDLVTTLQHEIARENKFPIPPVFDGRKERFGLTQARFLALRKGWLEYLTNATPAPGSQKSTWAMHWKELQGFHHYFWSAPEVLTSKHVAGATLDGLHFVRFSPSPEVRRQRRVEPLTFLHGWPGSFLEGLVVGQTLADPGPDVPLSAPAFDVTVPSLPGYVWSGSPIVRPNDETGPFSGPEGDLLVKDVANLVNELMLDLGFDKYSVTAGDWGSGVARSLAVQHAERVKAVHLNFMPSLPPKLQPSIVPKSFMNVATSWVPGFDKIADLPRLLGQEHFAGPPNDANNGRTHGLAAHLSHLLGLPSPLSERDAAKVQRGLEFQTTGSAYAAFHGTRPATLGNIMHTSPSALLSWIGEKFLSWTHHDPPDHDIFESLTLWWLTETMPRALYPYRNRPVSGGMMQQASQKENFIHRPVGFSDAPYELVPAPLEWAKGTANIVWHREHDKGGHFLAMERPEAYVDDIRAFFLHLQGAGEL
ncbi:unnamed protein product [Jaminaea pallidilutea]